MASVSRKNDQNRTGTGAGNGIEFSEPTSRGVEEFTRPAEEYPTPSWDKRPLPPEIVAPGKYQWEKPGQKRTKTVKTMAWLSAIVLILINMNILTGDMAKTFADILNIETTATSDASGLSAEAETETETEESAAPSRSGNSTSDAGATPDGTSPDSTSGASPVADTTQASAWEIPECDMTVFASYSEMMGSLKFRNLGNCSKITLEVWDVLTGTCEESRDITNDIDADGNYSIQPFTTDEIYNHHQTEYDDIMEFPMKVEFRVIVEYETADGNTSKTWSHITAMDRNMWFCKFIHEEDKSFFSAPIDILFSTDSQDGEAKVLFDQPEKAGPNVFSISLLVDGKPVDISGSKIFTSTYDVSGNGTEVHYYSDVYLLLPDGFDPAAAHDVKLYVYHYLEDYQAVCETVVVINYQ